MYGSFAQVVQPETPNQTVVAVFMSLIIIALISAVLRDKLDILKIVIMIYLAALLTFIPVVNQLGRAVFRFALAIFNALGADDVIASGIGVTVAVVLAALGIVIFYRRAIAPKDGEPRVMSGFVFLFLGLWFFLTTDQVRQAVLGITDFLTNVWNGIPGVG